MQQIALFLVLSLAAACVSADAIPTDWPLNGGNERGEHFSPLDQVNERNVGALGLDWSLDLPAPNGIAATPIVRDAGVRARAAVPTMFRGVGTRPDGTHDQDGHDEDRGMIPRRPSSRANAGVSTARLRDAVGSLDAEDIALARLQAHLRKAEAIHTATRPAAGLRRTTVTAARCAACPSARTGETRRRLAFPDR